MFFYHYNCKNCKKEFLIHKDKMRPTKNQKCPYCNSSKGVFRVWSPTPTIYKADGFTKKVSE
jgi:DNA-directed RNA polymerase subunit RPC12/RpoP